MRDFSFQAQIWMHSNNLYLFTGFIGGMYPALRQNGWLYCIFLWHEGHSIRLLPKKCIMRGTRSHWRRAHVRQNLKRNKIVFRLHFWPRRWFLLVLRPNTFFCYEMWCLLPLCTDFTIVLLCVHFLRQFEATMHRPTITDLNYIFVIRFRLARLTVLWWVSIGNHD